MYDKEDFFSPEMVDERLDLSLLQRDADASYQKMTERDPNLLLISDLSYLYGAEGTENVRSLQRVWEHLKAHPEKKGSTSMPASLEEGPKSHLRLLKPSEKPAGLLQHKREDARGRGLAVFAAMLFLLLMVGSLLTIVHLTRDAQANGATQASISIKSASSSQATAMPDYPYAPPGHILATSPFSTSAFAALAWSPDSQQLALSAQGKIWIWDLVSNHYRPLLDAQLAGNSVRALAWSPDGRYLAVGSNPIQIVNPDNGNVVGTYSADYPILSVPGQTTLVTALAWSPNGNMLAVATLHADQTCYVFVWDMLKGTGIHTFTQQGSSSGISSLSWSGDNRFIASSDAQTVQAWDIQNPSVVIFKHVVSAATNVAWSPQPGLLAFVNERETQVWNVWQGNSQTGRLINSYPAANGVLSWAPRGQYLATASKNTVIIFDTSSNAHIYTYTGSTHYVYSLAWSPDGNSIVSGESDSPGLNYARVWSA